jgi:hypothetical protein
MKGRAMNAATYLEIARLQGAERANADDASIWRWVADLMEERRLTCHWNDDSWTVGIDGHVIACERSFDHALRCARRKGAALPVVRRW